MANKEQKRKIFKSKAAELCFAYKLTWEENQRGDYTVTGRDLKEAKEILAANELDDLLEGFRERVNRYLESQFSAWKDEDWPAWGLFRHWNRYNPARRTEVKPLLIECPCGRVHRPEDKCQTSQEGA